MDNINGMSYDQLIELQGNVFTRLNEFNPVRLRKKWKRCGKNGCQCGAGPSDGSWGNMHGPYVFAQFTDNDHGKIRNVSLGRYYDDEALVDIVEKSLDFSDYYKIDPGQFELMTPSQKKAHYFVIFLDDRAFEKYHGISRKEDTMSRYGTFYGTLANSDAYDAASRALDQQKLAATHKWAKDYGVGSVKGQAILRNLLAGNYYLKI